MEKRTYLFLRAAVLGLALVPLFALFSPASADKDQEARYLDDLNNTRQDLTEARDALASLKSLYAEKEIQVRDLKIKLDSLGESLRRCQDSMLQVNKEKESLADRENKELMQLKQSETQNFILSQQNQVLSNCSKENDAKSRELTALRNSYAQDKKDLLSKVQENEAKLSRAVQDKEGLSIAKSELEVKCSVLSQQLADMKNQQISLLDDKGTLALKLQGLERELDTLRNDLADSKGNAKDLENASLKIKKQEGFEAELLQLRRKYAQLENELKLSEDENKRLTGFASKYDKQEGLRKELANLRRDLLNSEAQKSQIQKVCDKLRKQESDIESKFRELTGKLDSLQEENRKLRSEPARISDENAIKNELTCLREDLAKCKEEKKQLEKYSLHGNKENEDLNYNLSRMRERISLLEFENKRLQDAVSKTSAGGPDLQETALLRKELDQVRSENKQLKLKTSKAIEPAEAVSSEMAQLRSSLYGLEAERDRLKMEAGQLRQQQASLLARLAATEKEPKDEGAVIAANPESAGDPAKLSEDLRAAQELSYQLVKEKAGFLKREKELSQALLDDQKQKYSLELEKADLLKKTKGLETEYAKLSEQVARVMVQYSDLEKQKQSSAAKSGECQQELRFIQDKLKASEQFVSSLQSELENIKRANKELEIREYNTRLQKEQDVALTKAQLEQLNALKEGEYVQLNNKYQEYRAQKEAESRLLNNNIAKLKTDLQNSQDTAFQMLQEKGTLSGQQKQITEELRALRDKRSLMEQANRDLEKQNVFLKNQYVQATQELDTFKKEGLRATKGKSGAEQEECYREMDSLKKQLAEKDQEYFKKIKEYESKGSAGNNSALIEELTKLKRNYEELKKKYDYSERSRKNLETLKDRYGKLPEENANLHYNISVLYAQHQEYQKAVSELEKVIELKPEDAEAFYNLGVINGEYLGNRKKAIGYFEKYLALAPNDPEADRIRKYVLTWKTLGQEPNDK
jgi:chromosome segregation ATPase